MTAIVGLFGKLPVRGDFVRAGLPGGFVQPWDDWLQQVIAASRVALGEAWLPAWLEAPVWRFSLAAGQCGGGGALGLMLPSVDRVGRYFPLTLAAIYTGGEAPQQAAADAWLDACELAGRAALEQDAAPEQVLALVPGAPAAAASASHSAWWTQGGPRVAPTRLHLDHLPDSATFVAMLGGAGSGADPLEVRA